jgi:hypothetical protein
MEARDGASAARKRLRRRSWEIYKAFVLTGVLMLLFGLVLAMLVPAPAVRATEAPDFMAQPIATLLQVIGLARQPFVSDVLPMYAVFIGVAPLPSAGHARSRWPLSAAAWRSGSCRPLLPLLPSSEPRGWSFNPFAWQLMFAMGLLARLRPDFMLPQQTIVRRAFPGGAVVVALVCMAAAYLWMRPHVYEAWLPGMVADDGLSAAEAEPGRAARGQLPGAGMAGLSGRARGMGRAAGARFMGPVVQIGRHSLFCFVLGAVVSVGSKA